MFPMTVSKYSMTAPSTGSRGGKGKDYHCVLISSATGRCLVINRWGAAGKWGTGWSCDPYATTKEGRFVYEGKINDKLRGKGSSVYKKTHDSAKTVYDVEALKKELGLYWSHIGSEKLNWLAPGCDESGTKEVEPDEWEEYLDEHGAPRMRRKEKPPMPMPAAPAPTVEQQVAQDPDWGSW